MENAQHENAVVKETLRIGTSRLRAFGSNLSDVASVEAKSKHDR